MGLTKRSGVRLTRYGQNVGKSHKVPPAQSIADAARSALGVMREFAASQKFDADALSNHLRLCVVRALFRRLALLDGVFVRDIWEVNPPERPEFNSAIESFAWRPGTPAPRSSETPPGMEDDIASCSVVEASEMLSWGLEGMARDRTQVFTPRWFARNTVRKTLGPLFKAVAPESTLELRVCDPAVGGGIFLVELVSQLADRLVACGHTKTVHAARQLAAIHCAYGVDLDPVAVECTKLALWLECRAFAMPWTWLDDNIKCGDAIVGLVEPQLKAFHWKVPEQVDIETLALAPVVKNAVDAGAAARKVRMAALAAMALEGQS